MEGGLAPGNGLVSSREATWKALAATTEASRDKGKAEAVVGRPGQGGFFVTMAMPKQAPVSLIMLFSSSLALVGREIPFWPMPVERLFCHVCLPIENIASISEEEEARIRPAGLWLRLERRQGVAHVAGEGDRNGVAAQNWPVSLDSGGVFAALQQSGRLLTGLP